MHEPDNPGKLSNDIALIRNRRIGQTIAVLLTAVCALTLVNLVDNQPVVLPVLLFALIFLSFSLLLLRLSYAQPAALLTVLVMFICIAHAMWTGAGLRSSALLAYPAVMLFAMIMIGKRTFYLSYAAMMIYIAVLLHANVQGWRTGTENIMSYRWMFDYGIVLSAATFVIRVLATDLLALLATLRKEMLAVTESKLAAEHLAHHDNLTGLPNRRMAEHYFRDMLKQSQQDNSGMGLIFVDVDNFKMVNDSYGHQCGDDLLKHIGNTISSQLRRTDKLTRIAGDEFLILLPGVASASDIESILTKINSAVRDHVVINGHTLQPALSMGIALAPQHGSDFRELLTKADKALYEAKAAGRNRYQFFEPTASP